MLCFSVIMTACLIKAWTLTMKLTRFLLNSNLIGRNKGQSVLNWSISSNYIYILVNKIFINQGYFMKKNEVAKIYIYIQKGYSIIFNYREDHQRKMRSSLSLFIYTSCHAWHECNIFSSSFLSLLWNKQGRFMVQQQQQSLKWNEFIKNVLGDWERLFLSLY